MTFLDDLKKEIADVSEKLTKKSGEIVEVQKLKMKKSSLESDVKKNYVQLGHLYFQHMQNTGVIDEDAEEFFQNIVDANEAIDEIKDKLDQMSSDRICAVCGEKSPKTMAFCPHCGTKFETVKRSEEPCETEECGCEARESCETEECGCEARESCEAEAEVCRPEEAKACECAEAACECAEAACDCEETKEE